MIPAGELPQIEDTPMRVRPTALTEWIFPDLLKPESPTRPESAYRQLKKLLAETGLPDIRFHDLRHPNVKPKTKNFPCAQHKILRRRNSK